MAKRRKKKKKALLGSVLKYEIYGIVLITLSVIALSGEAAVGEALSQYSAFLFGRFYFVVPMIGIYFGLNVMIHRRWPSAWTSRHTGILLLVMALTLMSTLSAMERKLGPLTTTSAAGETFTALTPKGVLSQIHNDLTGAFQPPGDKGAAYVLGRDISGGYVGALEFALLLMLFGTLGAKLIMIVMLAISFMLITNLSYVELFGLLRNHTRSLVKMLRTRAANRPKAVPVRSKPAASKAKLKAAPPIDEEEEDGEEDIRPRTPRKQPLFFKRLAQWAVPGEGNREADHPDDAGQAAAVTAMPHAETQLPAFTGWEPETNEPEDLNEVEEDMPIIRDFFEHIRSEGLSEEDREEWAEFSPAARGTMPGGTEPAAENQPDGAGEHPLPASGGGELPPDAAAGAAADATGGFASAETPSEAKPAPPPPKPYRLPHFRLLSKPSGAGKGGDQSDYMQTARKLEATLESFGVRAKVLEVVRGPAVTRYEIQPDIGVKVSRIVNLTDDIALALAAKDIRMEAPIPGKSAIGIEVPNPEVSVVTMREVMETQIFQDSTAKLSIAFGRDISGQTIVGNLAKMPHLLVAGATGSGKSVCINGIITSILYKAKPNEVKFLMVDPKMVELNVYNGIPHLMAPVVTDPKRASLALKKIVVEMEKRYELFSKSGTRNVEGYNLLMKDNPAAVLPYIVVIVDELADLMMVAANDVEDAICRLAQMARAAGIHLIIATQRPSVDVITGVIKANIPSRIAFGVSSQVDSRTILDMAGAEKLLGRGDMLFMPMGASKPVRVQGAFLSDQEVEAVVHFVSSQGEAVYDESIVPEVEEAGDDSDEPQDELYEQAVQIVLEAKQASVSLLQRRMRVGYTRAARLIDYMESKGVIGPYEGSKPREVLVSAEQYQQNRISS